MCTLLMEESKEDDLFHWGSLGSIWTMVWEEVRMWGNCCTLAKQRSWVYGVRQKESMCVCDYSFHLCIESS